MSKKETFSLGVVSYEREEIGMNVSVSPNERDNLQATPRLVKSRGKKSENSRATLMLIIVCAIFLLTEFPQFVLIILSALDQRFYEGIYVKLGDLLDMIVLINSSINFILYCSMSKSFRDAAYSKLNISSPATQTSISKKNYLSFAQ